MALKSQESFQGLKVLRIRG